MTAEAQALAAVGALAKLEPAERAWLVARLTGPQRVALFEYWPFWAHDGQLPPGPSTDSAEAGWRTWLMMAGRGFGKTRAGAEWVSALARANRDLRVALVAATRDEVDRVMVRGESGLMAAARFDEDLLWYPTRGVVQFASGAQAYAYSGANPEALRGPQHDIAWCDELAKWAYPQESWDNLMLGLRLGEGARALVTTTPRPIGLLRRLIAAPDTANTSGRTADNLNLPDDFLPAMTARYGGTRLGRQELDGALIEDVEGALWTREMVEKCRKKRDSPSFSSGW